MAKIKSSVTQLHHLRQKIDRADRDLLIALAQRKSVVEKIGRIKARLGLSVVQNARWKEVLQDRIRRGQNAGLSQKFVKSLFELIHKESQKTQKNLSKNKSRSIRKKRSR